MNAPAGSNSSSPASHPRGVPAVWRFAGGVATASAMARMCSGVEPQHPPTMSTKPSSTKRRMSRAIISGVWSYCPIASGMPALGCTLTWHGVACDNSRRNGVICAAPNEQFNPTEKSGACDTDMRNASTVCPERVRPAASAMVAESIIGTPLPAFMKTCSAASRAALALSVSNTVSISSRSTPPSRSASICSAYAARSVSKSMARKAGFSTSGDIEAVLPVGPTDPATKRGLWGVNAVMRSASARAMRAAAIFIRLTSDSV